MDIAYDWLMVLEGRRVIYSNQGLAHALKSPTDNLVGQQIDEIFPSQVCKGLDGLMERMRASEGQLVTGDLECRDLLLDGSTLSVRGEARGEYTYLSIHRLFGEAGDSGRRLMEVEERLSALLGLAASAGIGLGVFEITPDGAFHAKSFNEHVVEIFNRPESELLSVSLVEFVHPDDREEAIKAIRSVLETGTTSGPMDLRIIDGEGEVVHIRVTNTMLSPPNEHLGISFVLDITPVMEALDQQNRMVQAVERVEETVVLADGRGSIFYVNPAGLKNSGYTLEEVMGKPFSIFSAPEGVDIFTHEAMGELLKQGWWRGDVMAVSKKGTRYPVEVTGSIVKGPDGGIDMFVIVSRKIQERQRFEARLAMAQGNHDRLRDLVEWDTCPKMEAGIGELQGMLGGGEVDTGQVMERLDDLLTIIHDAKAMIGNLPSPEQAEDLRSIDLDGMLAARLPDMVTRHRHKGQEITLDLQPSGKGLRVNGNEMLPDLVMRLVDILLKMATMDRPEFTVSTGFIGGSDIPGSRTEDWSDDGEPRYATISISAPGLTIGDELRSILARNELHTLGPLPANEVLAVETSRLLLFIYQSRIHIGPSEDGTHHRVVIMIPCPRSKKKPQ